MSVPTLNAIEYPESDGMPMGETDLHRGWMFRVYELLRRRYAGEQVYVGCDLLVYYVEGYPRRFCVPDVFVVKDCPPGNRRIFQTWVEGRTPDDVFEITSLATRREDELFKPQTYAQIGVKEYFLYDPTSEYLSSPLLGFRLEEDQHKPIVPDSAGAFESRELGLRLWLDESGLVLSDARTLQPLLTDAEAATLKAEQESRARQAAEEENRRLREELARLKRGS
jgi:Uma2 family endonuclease